MEMVAWTNGKGQTLQLERAEAKELRLLIDKALILGEAESKAKSSFDTPTKVEIT